MTTQSFMESLPFQVGVMAWFIRKYALCVIPSDGISGVARRTWLATRLHAAGEQSIAGV
jgi:hypothetical protein